MPKKRILTSTADTVIGTVQVFEEFDGTVQKIVITNNSNRSNFRTITKNIRNGDVYSVNSRLDIGDKYITYFRYEKGKIVLEKRFNRTVKSVYIKERVASTENGDVFLIDYNGQKSINFNIKKKGSNDRI